MPQSEISAPISAKNKIVESPKEDPGISPLPVLRLHGLSFHNGNIIVSLVTSLGVTTFALSLGIFTKFITTGMALLNANLGTVFDLIDFP